MDPLQPVLFMMLKSHCDDFSQKQLIALDNALFCEGECTVIFIICKQNVLCFYDFLGFRSSAVDVSVLLGYDIAYLNDGFSTFQ